MRNGWTWLNDRGCPFSIELSAHCFVDGKSLCSRFQILDESSLRHGKDDVAICPNCFAALAAMKAMRITA